MNSHLMRTNGKLQQELPVPETFELAPRLVIVDPLKHFVGDKPEPLSYTLIFKDLQPGILEDAIEVISNISGVLLTSDQLLSLIEPDEDLCSALVINGPRANDSDVKLLNALSESLIQQSWPLHNEDTDFKSFLKAVLRQAEIRGYTIIKKTTF